MKKNIISNFDVVCLLIYFENNFRMLIVSVTFSYALESLIVVFRINPA